MHYRLNDAKDVPQAVADALALATRSISDDPVVEADRQRLEELLAVSLEAGCRA